MHSVIDFEKCCSQKVLYSYDDRCFNMTTARRHAWYEMPCNNGNVIHVTHSGGKVTKQNLDFDLRKPRHSGYVSRVPTVTS